jgi:hypothetical protein
MAATAAVSFRDAGASGRGGSSLSEWAHGAIDRPECRIARLMGISRILGPESVVPEVSRRRFRAVHGPSSSPLRALLVTVVRSAAVGGPVVDVGVIRLTRTDGFVATDTDHQLSFHVWSSVETAESLHANHRDADAASCSYSGFVGAGWTVRCAVVISR